MDNNQLYLCNKVAAQLCGLVYMELDGDKYWYNYRHAPSYLIFIGSDGLKMWLKNGKLHREDGPAVIDENGNEFHYLNDEKKTKYEVVGN